MSDIDMNEIISDNLERLFKRKKLSTKSFHNFITQNNIDYYYNNNLPLYLACVYEKQNIVTFLIKNGADMSEFDDLRDTSYYDEFINHGLNF